MTLIARGGSGSTAIPDHLRWNAQAVAADDVRRRPH